MAESGSAFSAEAHEVAEQSAKEREKIAARAAETAEAAPEVPLAQDFAPADEPASAGGASDSQEGTAKS